MELKTLKDLEIGVHVGDCKKIVDEKREIGSEWTTSLIFAGDIKIEAIKWLKQHCEDCHYDLKSTFNKIKERNNKPITSLSMWIEFFNITEDDLE